MTIEELIERLENAEGANFALDNAIGELFEPERVEHGLNHRCYTGSIDAAVTLAEKVLKVYRLDICMDPSGESAKIVWWPKGLTENETTIKSEGLGWSVALSICIAVIKAKQEEAAHDAR